MSRTKYDWKRINSDVNGNPRYVLHFLNLAENYPDAVKLANKIGGRKYHTKRYGGGIVFQSYSLPNTEMHIDRVKRDAIQPEMLAALEKLTELAANQLDQSATHDGLENCKALADARQVIAKAKGGAE